MNWKKLLLPVIILCLLVTMSFLEVYAVSPVEADEAILFITETVNSLESSRQKIEVISQSGLLGTDVFKEVSLKEVDTKFNLSRDYLNLAIEKFNQGVHSEAKDLAFRARQNARLAGFYLDALLSQPTDIGVDSLTLGGDISQLLDIQEAIRLAQSTWGQFLLFTEVTELETDRPAGDEIAPESEMVEPEIEETELKVLPFEPDIKIPAEICLIDKSEQCKQTESECLVKVGEIINQCPINLENSLIRCQVYADRADSHQLSCEATNQTCLNDVFPTMMARCQVYADRAADYRPACKVDLDKCLNRGGLMAFIRGNNEETCRVNYDRCLEKASINESKQMELYEDCRQEAENYCPVRHERCLAMALTRENRDRERYNNCYDQAQTSFSACTDRYINNTERQAARCITAAGNCLNRAVTVCSKLK